MKLFNKLTPLATAAVVAATVLVTPTVQADISASVGIANMYLWRGMNEGGGSQISGELKWSGMGGMYGGTWLSSSSFGGSETDLFVGYGKKFGPVTLDLAYWNYLYPEASGTGANNSNRGLNDTDATELVFSAEFMGITAGVYVDIDGDNPNDKYFTVNYGMGDYSLTVGSWDRDPAGSGGDYQHITLSYAATSDLTFTVSKAFPDLPEGNSNAVEKDFLVQVAYGWSFDIKK